MKSTAKATVTAIALALAAAACGSSAGTIAPQSRIPAAAISASAAAAAARAAAGATTAGAASADAANAGTAGDACALLTVDEVATALGHAMKPLDSGPGLCAFQSTDPATPDPVMLAVLHDTIAINDTRATYTGANATAVSGLGDEALWLGPISEMFVRKGGVAFTLVDGSQIGNLSAGQDNAPSQARLTQLAKIVLGRI